MEDLKQKYLKIIYGKQESYSDDELQIVDNLIDTHKVYNKENLFTESQVLEYGTECFEVCFAKCDIVEAEYETDVFTWNYAVDLDWQPEEKTKPLKLTMEQIAEKFNAEKIEIVNYENKD